MNEEQTATLQTALLHRRVLRLPCGPRCEPLSGAPFLSRGHRRSSHEGLVELARRRSDLYEHLLSDVCCVMKSLCAQVVADAGVGAPGLTLRWLASNASPPVITAHRMRAFLLASATTAFCQPERSRSAAAHWEILSCVCAPSSRPTSRPGSAAAQVGVAALGDAAQAVLAAAGVLARRQAEPGAELRAVPELLEVAHGGHHRAGRDRADADQRGGRLHRVVVLAMRGDALVAPGEVRIELAPLRPAALQRQPGQRAQLVARVFEHVAEHGLELAGLCANTRPNSASRPRMRLMHAVRSSLRPSRSRCTHSMLCCSMDLTGMKRIFGREAASQIAAASLASFLPLAPCLR